MQFFCDVEKPDNTPFGGNCRGFLRDINCRFKQLGLRCNVGTECEFYLFENDDRGRPTRIPIDAGGYFDVAPLDAGENIRRDICLTMEQMGLAPQHSHHENGNGQNEIDFHYAGPLKTADNIFLFKQIVRAVAASNGLHSSFLPKPLPDQAGSGLHINLSLSMDGNNLFEGDIAPDSIPGSFMAGILRHSRELTAFTNPLPNSYLRFGCDEAPRYVSWSRQNRSQLVRIPQVRGDNCRMELRSPDPACNPYLAIGLILAAGLDGIEHRMELHPPVNKNLFSPSEAVGLGLEMLPTSLEEAVAIAEESDFLHKVLPEELSRRYYAESVPGARHCERGRPGGIRTHPLLQRHLTPAGTCVGERSEGNGTCPDRKCGRKLQRIYLCTPDGTGLCAAGDPAQRGRGAAAGCWNPTLTSSWSTPRFRTSSATSCAWTPWPKHRRGRGVSGQSRTGRTAAGPPERAGVLLLSKPFSNTFFLQAIQMAAASNHRLLLLRQENARLQDKIWPRSVW